MSIPSDPDHDPPIREFFTKRCPSCNGFERCSSCQAEGCGREFVVRPGYSRILCPVHDPGLAEAPEGQRDDRLAKSRECTRCGERMLGG